jgi:CubicO group peptidase (beta-lactamase class C family)
MTKLTLLSIFTALLGTCLGNPTPQEIDRLAEETLKEWGIPGLSLAVIKKGQELKLAGYGIKAKGFPQKVDVDTLFQISSLTKGFTALSVSLLAEEGELDWEEPVITYLPSFSLKESCSSSEISLRDLLCHRSGLPGISKQSWRLWVLTERSTEDLIKQLAYLDPAYPLRTHFSDTFMGSVVAGHVVAKISGRPWEQFCTDKIFKPLGMQRTNISYATLTHDKNAAKPHLPLQDKPIPWLNWNSMPAAAGINSTAADMSKWLKYCLSGSSALQSTLHPLSLVESDGFLEEFARPLWPLYTYDQQIVSYGLGWMIYTVNDKLVFVQTGMSDGMQSILAIVPEEELGIVILTNCAPHLGAICLLNQLLDRFFHRTLVDWHQRAHTLKNQIDQALENRKNTLQAERRREKSPTLRVTDYAGEYSHPAYGSILIRAENETLKLELFNHEKGKLQHWQENQFEVIDVLSSPPAPWIVEFQLSKDKKRVTYLKLPDLGSFDKH